MANQVETIVAAVVLVVLMVSVYLWAAVLARLFAGQPILPDQHPPTVPWGLIDMMLAMLIKIGMDIGMMAAAGRVFGVKFDTDVTGITGDQLTLLLLATSVSNLLTSAIVVVLLRLRHASWKDLGLASSGIGKDIRLGLAAFVVLAVPMYAIQALLTQLLPPDHPIITLLVNNSAPGVFYLACFAAVVAAPVAEEILFRVVLQGWLENLMRALHSGHREAALVLVVTGQGGHLRHQRPLDPIDAVTLAAGEEDHEAEDRRQDITAEPVSASERDPAGSAPGAGPDSGLARRPLWPVILTSLLFALAHSGQGPAPVPLFILSLGLGYMYQRTGRVLPCIIVHALVNGSSLTALALSHGG